MSGDYVWKLLVLAAVVGTVRGQSGDDVKTLMNQLFVTDSYNKFIRPMTDQTQPMEIAVEFILSSIIDFDEQEESISTAGYLSLYWKDEYLQWVPSNYNNVPVLFIPQEEIWKPDVSLRNSFKSFTGLGSTYLNLLVHSNGEVEWSPFQVLKSTCSVDITYFPFDTQSCDLKFIAWSYTKDQVILSVGRNGALLEQYSPNSAWKLVETSSREVRGEEAAVIVTIKLKRKPTFYIMNVALPVVLLTLLNVFTFALPASSGERNGFAITVFLALAVFLTIVAAELPKNSDVVSVFGVYLTLMTCLSTAVVVACLLLMRLAARDTKNHPIGKVFLFLHKVSRTLQCKRSCRRKNTVVNDIGSKTTLATATDDNKKKDDSEENTDAWKEDLTWADIVNSLDFLCFWFAILFTFVCTTSIAAIAVRNA